jgi:hypothetical protein
MESTNIDALFLPEYLRSASYKSLDIVDNPADVIREPSSRVGSVRTALKADNLHVRPLATGLRGRAHSRCVAADDN